MAVPMLVLENIQVVRIAVACEHQERPTVANMLWGTCPREVLGFPIARGQTSKFPPGDERRGFLDGVVPLVENHPSMFRVAIEVEIGGMEAPVANATVWHRSSRFGSWENDALQRENAHTSQPWGVCAKSTRVSAGANSEWS